MAVLKNRAKMSTSTTGTGTITLGSAEDGYQSFADAGVANADVVRYVIEDGSNFEIGTGSYTASGTLLSRTVSESSNSNNAINLSGSATVFIGATAEDIPALYAANEVSVTAQPSATGDDAVAIGDSAVASGANDFAIGRSATASGSDSIALGYSTTASGNGSLAALNSTASGSAAIAIGGTAVSSGTSAVAIGYGTDATSDFTTAVGRNAQARATSANAFGRDAWAAGSQATAIGDSYASGADSFAAVITNNTSTYGAQGTNSIAIGYRTKATHTSATSIGRYTEATGQESQAIGSYSIATALRSSSFGYQADATHSNSMSLGVNVTSTATDQVNVGGSTQAVRISETYTLPTADGSNGYVLTTNGSGVASWAAGGGGGASAYTFNNQTLDYTVVSSDLGKIISFTGGGSKTATLTSAATLGAGFYCFITSDKSTGALTIDPDGSETIEAASTFPIKRGQRVQIVSDGTNWFVSDSTFPRGISFDNANNSSQANASGSGAVALGYGSTASGGYTFAAGASSSAAGAVAGTGGGAVALGGSRASGADSFASAIGNNTSSYGATGASSIAMGDRAKATSADAIALGNFAIASDTYTFAVGYRAQATQDFSVAVGKEASSDIYGKHTQASGRFSATGDAQTGTFILRSDTTDATAEALTTNKSTASSTNQIILPNNSAYSFSGTIIARESAAAGSDYASWEIKGALLRDANAASTVLGNGIQNKLYATSGASAWAIALSADTTNGGLKIEVTGAASTSVRWVATVNTSEVTYA
jgi:trimeric autotransporter adhesin